ncbi:MAG: peptidoglycan binding domain-containing protein [Anaerolineae bacterium]|nr:peptidoglycan binding domain-containing protein [Anaerolineae bacterium]
MGVFPPETGHSQLAPESDSAQRRGRARQRQMARHARRVRPRQAYVGQPDEPQDEGFSPSAVLERVTDLAARAWYGFLQRSLRGQATLIVVVLIGLVGLFTLMSLNASENILPGVAVNGMRIGGASPDDAIATLRDAWAEQAVTFSEGERTWTVSPAELGITLDTAATVERAMAYGRDQGLFEVIKTALGGADIQPVVDLDLNRARDAVYRLAGEVYVSPRNASVEMQGALVTHVDAQPGRKLNTSELLPMLAVDPLGLLEQDAISLPMQAVPALITDAAPLVTYAQALLERPLTLEAYDPVADETHPFTLQPGDWGQWLDTRLVYHDSGPRLYLSVSASAVRAYLEEQAQALPDPLTLDLGDGVRAVQESVADGSLNTWVTMRYEPVEYTVGRGESAYSISRTQGIPFYLIEAANPDRDLSELYVGDTITLPSRDVMLPLRPVRNKRIVVDLSDQYLWAYEDGQIVYEWPISSGISSAPTSVGVFQILSHVEYAYGSSYTLCDANTCGQWVMHWFMGVYEAVPGLVNGFHGAVELPNGTYLGGGNVGRPFTFGCIMSVEDNAKLLYDWADQGVVVEIRQ